MDYRVVFDVTQTFPDLLFVLPGVLFIIVGALLVYGARREGKERVRSRGMSWFAYAFFGFAVLWTAGAGCGVMSGYMRAQAAVREGKTELVEGVVEGFTPMPEGGHADESFVVSGHSFRYSSYVSSDGFSQTMVRGGPVRDGQHVRIHAYEGAILKLEIAETDLASLDPSTVGSNGMPFPFFVLMPIVLLLWIPMVPLAFFAIASLSGWRRLALRFRGTPLEGADAYVMQSGRVNVLGNYRSVLNVRVSKDAFSVVPMIPFAFFHEQLVIPWSAVASVEMEPGIYRKGALVMLEGSHDEIKLFGTAGRAVFEAFQEFRAR